ncbi:bacteriorhodopsin [Nisaea sp.]|uniref:bacteriorhodopsin n=1 Tax=Nisaea sp. TaxID=2024842 RepID=UPI0032EBC3CF
MNEYSLLVLATQYSFTAAFAAMAAGTLYFMMERNNLTPEYSPVASLCAMVSLVAAINYFVMKDTVGLDGQAASLAGFATDYRYIDWLITTPLLLAVLPVLLGRSRMNNGMMARLLAVDVLMIVVGYIGEVSINRAGGGTMTGWWCLLISMACWFYILYVLFAEIGRALEGADSYLKSSLGFLRTYLVISWVVYPLGYLIAVLDLSDNLLIGREMVYCIADVIAKVGFGMAAVSVAKRLSAMQWEARS